MSNLNTIEKHPLIIFDGICNLCTASVQTIIKRDPSSIYQFANFQSPAAQAILSQFPSDVSGLDSIVLVTGSQILTKSDAVLQICRSLSGFIRYLYVFRVLPKSLRDWLYDWIARNRYHWFGSREKCMIPTQELEDRFLS
ncbi:MAG: thiol-disulfide oxidoreductase DCC family protein [Candidatus Marinimicrobia bacterium]|nr:thiol-disulfide oxidoreductase DCC family protein [Candidatus Neomarinimicrobiota bacterium]